MSEMWTGTAPPPLLPPLDIRVVPSGDVDPTVWYAFRFAAARAVADLVEDYQMAAIKADG